MQGLRFIPGDQYHAGTESDILPFMAQARVLRFSGQTLWPTNVGRSLGPSHTTYRVMKGVYKCSRAERNVEPAKVRDRESQFGLVKTIPLPPACLLPTPALSTILCQQFSSLAFFVIPFQHICLISI